MKLYLKIIVFYVFAQLLNICYVEAKLQNIPNDFLYDDEISKVTVSYYAFIFIKLRFFIAYNL